MNRLEKKCFIASACTHTVLLVLLFAAPAMMFSKKKDTHLAVVTFLPVITTDQMAVGGGNPAATQAPAQLPQTPPAQPAQQTEPPPAAPPAQNESEVVPEPKSEPLKPSRRTKTPPEPAPKPLSKQGTEPSRKKQKDSPQTDESETVSSPDKATDWKPSFTRSSQNQKLNAKNAEAKARADAAARAAAAQRAFANKIQQSLNTLGSSFAPGTSIEVPGAGGALFANYKLTVEAMYQQAWITPEDVSQDSAVVRAKVVIRRDGTVIEARAVKTSGIRAMDKSVERALELKFIAPFPEDSKDSQRIFYINFDLKTKRSLG